jgi:excisionase family DNA binding protein
MSRPTGRGFTRPAAAEHCGVSVDKIKRAIRANELPAYRNGRDIILRESDLDAWMSSWEVA